ncbi:hypothetical protein [Streptomyces rubradiris]|nr:hypothetical protein [Streptomyces rubradiris]
MTSEGADELRARHYLRGLGARPLGHQEPTVEPRLVTPTRIIPAGALLPVGPPARPPSRPEGPPSMLLALLAAALLPGAITTWLMRHRGWAIALLAGIGATAALPFLLLTALVVFPPLGFAVGIAAGLAALDAFGAGRIWAATALATVSAVALACAGWSL